MQFTYLPILRALDALHDHDSAKALELLRPAAPYDIAIRGSWSAFFGNLYPIYVRGLIYLAAGRGAEAAAEFQKILDHPGIMFADPAGPLARLQLARALMMAGDQAKAKSACEAFLSLWKEADSDIPVLQQAKAQYASLQR